MVPQKMKPIFTGCYEVEYASQCANQESNKVERYSKTNCTG